MPALPPPTTSTSWWSEPCGWSGTRVLSSRRAWVTDRSAARRARRVQPPDDLRPGRGRGRSGAGLEAEADAADRDHALAGLGGLELVAQATDGDVEGLGRAVPVLVPDLVHQGLAGHDLVVVGREDREHVELLGGQRDLALAEVD